MDLYDDTPFDMPEEEDRKLSQDHPYDMILSAIDGKMIVETQLTTCAKQTFAGLKANDVLCDLVYRISNYTPHDVSKFEEWKKVIPNLRDVLVNSASGLRAASEVLSLARISLSFVPEIYEFLTEYNDQEYTRQLIQVAVNKRAIYWEDLKIRIQSLDEDAYEGFTSNVESIISMIGPNSNNIDELVAQEIQTIIAARKKIEKIVTKQGELDASIKSLNTAIAFFNERLGRKREAHIEAKERSDRLKQMNENNVGTLNEVEATKVQTSTTSFLFGLFSYKSSKRVQNTDRNSEIDFYRDLISRNFKIIKESDREVSGTEKKVEELESQLLELVEKHKTAENEYLRYCQSGDIYQQVQSLQSEIEDAQKKIESHRDRYAEIVSSWGLEGSTLMECLSVVKNLNPTQRRDISFVKPLLDFIELIDIKMTDKLRIIMNSTDQEDRITAAKSLRTFTNTVLPEISSLALDVTEFITKPQNQLE